MTAKKLKDPYRVNVRNVRRVIAFFKTLKPKQYAQDTYCYKDECGSVACICGWINLRFTGSKLPDDEMSAGQFLGFNMPEQRDMFSSCPIPSEWPNAALRKFDRAKSPRGRLSAAIAALEQIAKDRRWEPGVTK